MKNSQLQTIKKKTQITERNKTLIRFLILILVSGFFGGCLSLAIGRTEEDLASLGDFLEKAFVHASYILLPVIGLLLLAVSFFWYLHQKKRVSALTGDDSDYDMQKDINHALDRTLCLIGLNTVLASLLYGFSILGLNQNLEAFRTMTLCICYLVTVLCGVFLQRKVIDLQKEMNPEKKGDVLSMHFQKDWIASCDELEKMIIYKSAYKSYIVVQRTSSILFGIVVLLGIWYPIGILPLLVVAAIWIVSTVSYTRESMKLTYKNEKANTDSVE